SPLTIWLARRLVRTAHMGLPNIVAGKRVVPELLQEEAIPTRIAEEAGRPLRDPDYAAGVRRELEEVRRRLGSPGASARAARLVVEYL
ncbi:MAG: lipid-A-disaccharide synthase, partial [Nitrospirae bacterium]|nr:lipid-A-disaccharide synthase [Nitrospirota bacterium]